MRSTGLAILRLLNRSPSRRASTWDTGNVKRILATALIAILVSAPVREINAQPMFLDGFEESCNLDDDDDRLVNCQESAYGTSKTNPDTDGDGLHDGDEVLGTTAGLDLPALGVNPRHKDILIEHDWTDDTIDRGALHSHKPSQDSIEQLRQAFALAPVTNPDGFTGINIINDVGQGGIFTGGNVIDVPNGEIQGAISDADFASHKSSNLANNRIGFFHYVIHAHRYTQNPFSSGQAEIVGDDIIVSLQCSFSDDYVRNTLMHELGHNLGLLHGGNTVCNYKPNYNSVMNYAFQFPGIDANCDQFGDGLTSCSSGSRITIDENSVNESLGICGNVAVDWNYTGTVQDGIQIDINPEGNVVCGGTYTILSDFNDWANLTLASLPNSPDAGLPAGISECQNSPVNP